MSGSGKDVPSRDELEQMSTEELVKLGTNLDGVETVSYTHLTLPTILRV